MYAPQKCRRVYVVALVVLLESINEGLANNLVEAQTHDSQVDFNEGIADTAQLHQRVRRANKDSTNNNDGFTDHVWYYGVAAAIAFVFLVVILLALICCCVIHKNMENRRKVAPASGNVRAQQNWQMLRGKIPPGGVNNQNSNKMGPAVWAGGTNQGRQPSNGNAGKPGWTGPSSKFPHSKASQAQMVGFSNTSGLQNKNGRLANLNNQLRDDDMGNTTQTQLNGAPPRSQTATTTPSSINLDEKPRQPPSWQRPNGNNQPQMNGAQNNNASNKLNPSWQPPVMSNGAPNSTWGGQNGGSKQGQLNGNSNQNWSNRHGGDHSQNSDDQKTAGWMKVLFDL